MTTPIHHPPVKRSVTIAGHETSISLEPLFWSRLEAAAMMAAVPLSALVARIDAERLTAPTPPNLASALRCWLLAKVTEPPTDSASPRPPLRSSENQEPARQGEHSETPHVET